MKRRRTERSQDDVRTVPAADACLAPACFGSNGASPCTETSPVVLASASGGIGSGRRFGLGTSCTAVRSFGTDSVDTVRNYNDAQALLVQELNDLTSEQRQKAYEDVHGVSVGVEETSELLRCKLDDFSHELKRFTKKRQNRAVSFAYEQAVFLSPQRVRHQHILLSFLRCEEFDVPAAVTRYVRYFHAKLRFFGVDSLVRDVRLDDLSKQDTDFLRQGFLQHLPTTDHSGRPILMAFNKHSQFQDPMNLVRTTWYMMMTQVRSSIVVQQKGIVVVANETVQGGKIPPPELTLMKLGRHVFECLPVRISAFHFCYDNPAYHPMMAVLQVIVGRQSRVRFRSHYGSDTECRYRLMTFGIRSDSFPVDRDGFMDVRQHHAWLERRRHLESNGGDSVGSGTTLPPTQKDILLGKGRPYQEFPGNRRMDQIVAEHWEEYRGCGKLQKTELFRRVVKSMKTEGTRFLKKKSAKDEEDADEWYEVEDAWAHRKVAHSFRNHAVMSRYRRGREGAATAGTTLGRS